LFLGSFIWHPLALLVEGGEVGALQAFIPANWASLKPYITAYQTELRVENIKSVVCECSRLNFQDHITAKLRNFVNFTQTEIDKREKKEIEKKAKSAR
jgi:hypothetical protein